MLRRILTAFAVFGLAASLLAVAEAAKKPIKVAIVKSEKKPKPDKPRVDEYLPVHHFGGY